MVIGSYGDPGLPRPKFVSGTAEAAFSTETRSAQVAAGVRVRHLDLVGLEFTPGVADTTLIFTRGILSRGAADDLLVEDCYVHDYQYNLTLVSELAPATAPLVNVRVRRSVVADAYGAGTGSGDLDVDLANRSQGLYADGVQGLAIEENVFDHNGWSESVPDAGANMFSQDVYLNTANANVRVTGNVIARASGHGLQARAGGVVRDNVFLADPFAIAFGYTDTSPGKAGGVSGEVADNVVLGSRDVPWDQGEWALEVGNTGRGIGGSDIHDNLIVGDTTGTRPAIRLRAKADPPPTDPVLAAGYVGLNDLTLQRNTVYGWTYGVTLDATLTPGGTGYLALNNLTVRDNDFQRLSLAPIIAHGNTYSATAETWAGNRYDTTAASPAPFALGPNATPQTLAQWRQAVEPTAGLGQVNYADPTRSAGSYNATLGGPGTLQAFLAAARGQSRANWRPQYTAYAVNDYVRGGFAVAAASAG
jgi:hypothetical protein